MNKVMIKRENIQNIQRIILSLFQDNREGVSQSELYNLVEELNLAASSNQGAFQNNPASSKAFSSMLLCYCDVLSIILGKSERETKLNHFQQKKLSSTDIYQMKQTPSKTVTKAQVSVPEWYTKLKQMKATKH